MRRFNPYINFSGKCREALAFYAEAFKGEIANLMTGADSGQEMPEEHKQNVLHAEFKAEGIYFMASDGRMGEEIVPSGQISRLTSIRLSVIVTARAAPMRSTTRLSSRLPASASAPNQPNIRLICSGLAPKAFLYSGAA